MSIEHPVVPAGKDAIYDLNARELAEISRLLKCDVMAAVGTDVDGKRIDAMVHLGWKWERRTTPAARLDPWYDLSYPDLVSHLRMDDDAEEVDEEPENPTAPASASE